MIANSGTRAEGNLFRQVYWLFSGAGIIRRLCLAAGQSFDVRKHTE